MNLDFRSSILIDAANRFEEDTRCCECSQCTYSQVFAVQPGAICTHPFGQLKGRAVCAGQPACEDMVDQKGKDLRLAMWLVPSRVEGESFARPHAA